MVPVKRMTEVDTCGQKLADGHAGWASVGSAGRVDDVPVLAEVVMLEGMVNIWGGLFGGVWIG